ncbi:MAG: TonB-dependent receptor [Pseudomonadota bacterium]
MNPFTTCSYLNLHCSCFVSPVFVSPISVSPRRLTNTRSDELHKRLSRFIASAGAALTIAATPSLAQEKTGAPSALEEIVVTAELRDTPWLEQPSSSTVLAGSLAKARTAAHLENLLQLAPNVNASSGSSRTRFFQLRGIGERSQFVEPLNPSVGVLIDNIDFSGLGTIATAYDIDQVEVLRGPQGTLHGANALAGLINIRSQTPTEAFQGRINGVLGTFGRRDLGLALSGPLGSDSLLGRLSVFDHQSDGFIENAFLGVDDTNERDELSIRGKLAWTGNDRHAVDLTLMHVDIDNGYDAFSLDNTRSTLSDEPGRDRQESDAAGLHYTFTGDSVVLELLASTAQSTSEYSYDEDWSFVGIEPELEYSSFDRYLRDRDSHSFQARLSSREPIALAVGNLSWTVGAYGLSDDESLKREYTFLAEDFASRFRADTLALFGQGDLELSESWTLSLGLRLAQRDMDYEDSQEVMAKPSNDLWGGKVALQYFSERLGMFYASVSRGYRAGGVNAQILAFPPDSNPTGVPLSRLRFFDDETLINYELGHKAQFLNDRLQSSLALFYMDRNDQQVRGSIVIPRGDGSTAFVDFTDNAASGSNLGLEWELRAAATERLQLYFNLGLLATEFQDYINADGRDLSGRDQAHAPNWQFASGLSYQFAKGITFDLQWEGRDSFFWSDRHDERSGTYSLWHSRISYQSKAWELALWGRNLFDKDYFVRGFGSFGNDPRNGYITEEYVQFGEPNHWGISFEYRL